MSVLAFLVSEILMFFLTNTRLQFESSVVQVPFKSNASAEKLNTKQAQNSIPAADLGASAFIFFLFRRIVTPARSCG